MASLHYRHKYYANVPFMSYSSSAPTVRFRLGRMTTVIIKLVEGNIKRQFLIFFVVVKKKPEKICVIQKVRGREAVFGVSFSNKMTYVLVQHCSKN